VRNKPRYNVALFLLVLCESLKCYPLADSYSFLQVWTSLYQAREETAFKKKAGVLLYVTICSIAPIGFDVTASLSAEGPGRNCIHCYSTVLSACQLVSCLKMEAMCYPETSVSFHITRHYNPEDHTLQNTTTFSCLLSICC
jgi:hypothetical protein